MGALTLLGFPSSQHKAVSSLFTSFLELAREGGQMGLSEGHVIPESLTQLLGKGHRVSRDRRASACPRGLVHFVMVH